MHGPIFQREVAPRSQSLKCALLQNCGVVLEGHYGLIQAYPPQDGLIDFQGRR